MTSPVILAHTGATLAMVGLIWFVQVVHYPLAAAFGSREYARRHVDRTGWVVVPFMIVETACSVYLVVFPPAGVSATLPWIGLSLLAGIWLSTAFLQVPAHSKLVETFDRGVANRLVRTNWIRTVLWSARGVVALALIGATG